MSLEEAIEFYNNEKDNEVIKKYQEATSIISTEKDRRSPKEEFYKSSTKYDYYILFPYESLQFTENGIEKKKYYYDAIGKNKSGKTVCYFCLALCNYSKDKIIKIIENHIVRDNEVSHE